MTYEERLTSLRAELVRRQLDGFIVPIADEHLSEYVGEYAQRLAWLCGFRGSAGTAVVLANEAAIFVDGRYEAQVRQQVDGRHWTYESLVRSGVATWLCEHAPQGSRIAYDPWLHSQAWASETSESLRAKQLHLLPVTGNPMDAIWLDRPQPSTAKVLGHPADVAGRSSADKRHDVARWLQTRHADTLILCALDSIAWVFNLRGQDIPRTPVALAYALIHSDATADLFVAAEKLTAEVIEHLGTSVRLHSRDTFATRLPTLAVRAVVADPKRTVAAVLQALELARVDIIEERDPVALSKAIKNSTEIAGHKAAQLRDGTALSRFLHWLSLEVAKGDVTELSAADKLRRFREQTGLLRDVSFETISAYGPSGAIVHYHATEETCRALTPGSLYLVDSGGQYVDGTTDVTRTVAIGAPTAEMKNRFTHVLKGHIALARVVFPSGTRGSQLDTIARQHLWRLGLDYPHGTGHGVGSYLCVHEGPQRISKTPFYRGLEDEPLAPGMVLSNEPGYYKAGAYGIRIENLMLVVTRDIAGASEQMLGFEVLSFAPIDRTLVDIVLLTDEERTWIDAYHAEVQRMIGPLLDGSARAWLREATQPLG